MPKWLISNISIPVHFPCGKHMTHRWRNEPWFDTTNKVILPRVCKRWFLNGGSSLDWRANSRTPCWPQFYLDFYLFYFKLTSAQLAISNHGLEITVYRPLVLEKACVSSVRRTYAYKSKLQKKKRFSCRKMHIPTDANMHIRTENKNPAAKMCFRNRR